MIEEKYKDIAELSVSIVEAIRRTGLKVVALRDRYAKFVMPLEGNVNHVGAMYAGSLFTLGEFTGGIVPGVSFDITRYFPIVKEIKIKYIAMAKTDIHIEAELSQEEVKRIEAEADENGKADITMDLELKNTNNEVVAIVNGVWQIRKLSDDMKNIFKIPGT
ncbi:DUF4442 domain-containing protein [bacterium]|nr:DUF4442 domain-containing protein [bacterium]